MSPRDEAQILLTVRQAITRVVAQLDRDGVSLSTSPKYANGVALVADAHRAAVRLAQTLEPQSTSEHP